MYVKMLFNLGGLRMEYEFFGRNWILVIYFFEGCVENKRLVRGVGDKSFRELSWVVILLKFFFKILMIDK